MDLIPRTEYMEQLTLFQDKDLIKVITGVRRCGKTTLMMLFKEALRRSGVADRAIVSVNFEDFDAQELTDPKALHDYLKSRLIPGKTVYFFLDEIQHVRDFPRVLDSLYIRDGVDLYVTGSNANLLSSEIATLISGRYVEVKMLPLSFREFVGAQAKERSLAENYRLYLEQSAFPYALALESPTAICTYLDGIYSTILVKDVMQRRRIADSGLLESVTRFLFDSIGSLVSTKKIADTLTSRGRKIDVKTVEKYVSALTESFVLYEARRYDILGKEQLARLEKYYLVDLGLRRVVLGNRAMDVGHVLENVVYLELVRRGFEVYVGKADDTEVDFVAKNEEGFQYFQVAATVRDSAVLKRELRSLQKIQDSYPKLLLTLDEDPETDFDGIRRVNVLRWLIGETSRQG